MEYADTETIMDAYASLPGGTNGNYGWPLLRKMITILMDHRGEPGAEEALRQFATGFEEG